ncbi:hypothetical protein PF008_g17607 [Phytophthora fragariae]|uniref:Uncharacterized protein n=1 Tax=Phytophthora fragariae TaxID=53985 RepID=A0A6G0R7U1_9STRA|nr:hypothetical protein PF008_g17607 [Phytophthora fragariae]
MPSDGSVADNIAVLADASARSKNMDRIRRPSLESQQVLAQVIRNVLRRMQTNFLVLTEKAVVMTVIIKFWKEKNPQVRCEGQQVLAQVIRNVLRRMQTNFLALAEKAVAMTVVIKFWKEKNPQSGRFEALFSDARILLFQFHALT